MRKGQNTQSIMRCKTCGKDFAIFHSWVGKRKFCCRRCQGIWLTKHISRSRTKIEIKIERELKNRGVNFKIQYPIGGLTIVDFFIPQYKLIIYCDGDYWHRLKGIPERDRNQNTVLKTLGYKVFRFREKEINVSPKHCVNKVIKYLRRYRNGCRI